MRGGRGDFFLSLSLSDFILTLLFLILLVSLWSLRKGAGDLREARAGLAACESVVERCDIERVRDLEEQVAMIREILEKAGQDPKEIERLILVALKDAQKLQDLELAARTLADKNRSLEERIAALEQEIAALTPADTQGNPIDVASLVTRLDDAETQLVGCKRQMEQCGLGLPPCWSDAKGRLEYLYAVTIHEDGVSVAPRWPAGRAEAVERIPGAIALPGVRLSLDEFDRRAAPILAWSEEKECRHYVYIRDEAETKDAFKRQLLEVEGFFYKYLERDAAARGAAQPIRRASDSGRG